MSDINKLEKRIENLEFYTSLSLLENETLNMQITDSDGLNRFKSGFFVDDFSNTDNQLKTTIVKNAIDYNDQMIYVNQNPEKFAKDAIFKDGEFVDTDLTPREERTPITPGIAAGGNIFELNELAKAFLS